MKKETRIAVGSRLRELRLSFGKTQDDFAELLGVTPGHYRKLEAGAYELTQEHMIKLYHEYQIDPKFLLLGEYSKKDFMEDFINCPKQEKISRFKDLLYYGYCFFHSMEKNNMTERNENRGGK